MTHFMRIIAAALTLALAGCGGTGTTLAPSPAPVMLAPPSTTQPIQPHIDAIAPAAGVVAGGTWGTITGSGFRGPVSVSFGGGAASYAYVDSDGTIVRFATPAHAAGTVDVVVTNTGGLGDTAFRGFTFAPRGDFDFNGVWEAHAGGEYETPMTFTITGNRLVSVSCGDAPLREFSSPAPVIDGAVSIDSDGIQMSGQLVAADHAVGTTTLGSCAARWWADRADRR